MIMWSIERSGHVGANGCKVVGESVRDVDAHFQIGSWALSVFEFESNSVRRQVGYLTQSPHTASSSRLVVAKFFLNDII